MLSKFSFWTSIRITFAFLICIPFLKFYFFSINTRAWFYFLLILYEQDKSSIPWNLHWHHVYLPAKSVIDLKQWIAFSFVLAFQVLYWTDDPKESTAGKVRVNGNVTAKNITGLKANTVYFATVRAYNTAGTGPSSAPVNVTTKKSREYSILYNKCCRLPGGMVTFQLTMTQLC